MRGLFFLFLWSSFLFVLVHSCVTFVVDIQEGHRVMGFYDARQRYLMFLLLLADTFFFLSDFLGGFHRGHGIVTWLGYWFVMI